MNNNAIPAIYGISASDYDILKTQWSQLQQAQAHNDYCIVSLFSKVRSAISKSAFYKLLTEELGYTPGEVSYLNRMLSAFQKISDKNLWEMVGYSGIQKILSLPADKQNDFLATIHGEDNLTVNRFNVLFQGWQSKHGSCKSESSKGIFGGKHNRVFPDISPEKLETIIQKSVKASIAQVFSHGSNGSEKRGGKRRSRGNRGGNGGNHGSIFTETQPQPMMA